MTIRAYQKADSSSLIEVARKLPEWFTPSGLQQLILDLVTHNGLVVLNSLQETTGFIIYRIENQAATLLWMGVHPDYHRQKIGKNLLDTFKSQLTCQGVRRIFVSTLGDKVDYEPYERTRNFYRKNGFRDYQRIDHPDNPEQEEELILKLEWPDNEVLPI
jgi:ribosomal protein S18 acetylase RimI-like enzyme